MRIQEITAPSFRKYGKILRSYDVSGLLEEMKHTPLPDNDVIYVPSDQDMEQLVESIQEHGILSPLTVRTASNGAFELISGHRRKHAAEIAGLVDVPCIIKDLTDDEAVIAMVDSNLQRETIKVSAATSLVRNLRTRRAAGSQEISWLKSWALARI